MRAERFSIVQTGTARRSRLRAGIRSGKQWEGIQAALVPAESGENALQLSLRSRMKPGWPLAGLLTCASPNFDSPSQGLRPSGLKHRVKTLRAYSYGVVTDLHRLPSTRLKRGYPGWVPGSNFWRSNGVFGCCSEMSRQIKLHSDALAYNFCGRMCIRSVIPRESPTRHDVSGREFSQIGKSRC